MRSSRRILLAAAMPGLALAALASSPAVAESEAEAHKRLKLQQPRLTGEWAPKPAPTPKKGKPTKAEKKAAKRARTRGVAPSHGWLGTTENVSDAEAAQSVLTGRSIPEIQADLAATMRKVEDAARREEDQRG